MDGSLYDKLGEENLRLLVDRFYDLVFENEQIARLFKTDKALIKEKQRMFLTQFLVAPRSTLNNTDTSTRARHLPHPIGEEDAVAWLQCMSQAVTSLSIDESIKDEIFKRLLPTAMFMVNKGVDY